MTKYKKAHIIRLYKLTFLTFFLLVYVNMAYAQIWNFSQLDTVSLNLQHIENIQPQNIIFILTDDQRYDDIGFMDHPFLETPNMDWLADHGFNFNRTIVTSSLCSPSRASILTGLYAYKHKVINNYSPMPEENIFFPQYLQRAGYQTAFIGKWHMGGASAQPRKGFDYWVSFRGQGVYYNPTLNENGKQIKYGDSAYITNLLTNKAIHFLKNRNKNQPFFLYLSHKAAHGLWYPDPRDKGYYKDIKISNLPKYLMDPLSSVNDSEFKDMPMWVKDQRNSWHGAEYPLYNADSKILRKYYKRYTETLLGVDRSIGRILDYLRENGLMKNTMVIYMSDNGFQFGDHGLIDKRSSYKASIRVPLLIYDPQLLGRSGTKINKLAANVDIAPTILTAAGLKPPSYIDGSSLIPLMMGETENWRDYLLYEYYWEYRYPMTPTQFALIGDRYKYINYYGIWDTNELYDLKNDPDEQNNLIRDSAYMGILKQMKRRLFNILEQNGGMYIPLYREPGGQQNLRNIHKSERAEFLPSLIVDPDTIGHK